MANNERTIEIGNTTVVVSDHHFSDGYVYCYLDFYDLRTRPTFPLTDVAVSRHLLEMSKTPTHETWVGGYLTGWCEAMLEGSDETFTSVLAEGTQP